MHNVMPEDNIIPGPDTRFYESHFRNNNGRLRLIVWPTESPGPHVCFWALRPLSPMAWLLNSTISSPFQECTQRALLLRELRPRLARKLLSAEIQGLLITKAETLPKHERLPEQWHCHHPALLVAAASTRVLASCVRRRSLHPAVAPTENCPGCGLVQVEVSIPETWTFNDVWISDSNRRLTNNIWYHNIWYVTNNYYY